jgi:cysteinyl-tRNA synthetase
MIRFYSTVSFTRNYLTENLFIVQIIKRAAEAKQDPKELAQRFEQEFVEDMKTLSVLSNNSLSAAVLRFTVMLSVRGMYVCMCVCVCATCVCCCVHF